MQIAHVVNPVKVDRGSDLFVAQPITFESMRVAAEQVKETIHVQLVSAQFEEDRLEVPDFFTLTRDLERSSLDIGSFAARRKLPLIGDIIDRMKESVPEADLYIYTNADIAVVPNFYSSVAAIATMHDAIVINRRTISADFHAVDQLALMYAEVGTRHPGWDCFAFSQRILHAMELGHCLVGVPFVGRLMLCNLAMRAQSFVLHKELHLTFHIGNDGAWKNGDRLNTKQEDLVAHNRSEFTRTLNKWSAAGLLQDKPEVSRYLPKARTWSAKARSNIGARLRKLRPARGQ